MNYKKYKIKEIGEIVSGATPKTSDDTNFGGNIAWITPADLSNYTEMYISKGKRSISAKGYESCSAQLMPAGTVLFSSRAPIGYVAIAKNPVCTNQGFKSVVPNENVNSEFLYYQLKYLKKIIQDAGSGTTFKEISAKRFGEIEVVIPPLEEQKRVVSKIEEMFSNLDASISELRAAKEKLKVYRQATLTNAFPTNTDESEWARLDSFSEITGGITKGRKLSEDEIIELPYLRVANVQNGYLDLTEVKTIELKANEKEKYLLQEGDVLYTEGGDRDKLGRGTVWRNEIPDCVHQNHIFRARVDRMRAIPEYVAFWSMGTWARNYFYAKGKQSVNLASINKTVLSGLKMPLPSLEEQKRIIQDIEDRLSVCDSIETTIDSALQQADALRQSILKEAFEGRLK